MANVGHQDSINCLCHRQRRALQGLSKECSFTFLPNQVSEVPGEAAGTTLLRGHQAEYETTLINRPEAY